MQLIVMRIRQDGNDSECHELCDAAQRSSWQWSSAGDKLLKPEKNKPKKIFLIFFEANKVRCLSANRNPPGSLQKAVNRSIFAWVLLVFLLLRHLLIISSHSITADISMLMFPTSPFLCYLLRSTRAGRRFFAVALSWFSSPHLPVLQRGSLLLSVTGNLFLPDQPPFPPTPHPHFQRPEEQIKQESPRRR